MKKATFASGKVNVGFVIGLAVGILALFAGAAYVAVNVGSTSAAEHYAKGQQQEAEGKFDAATESYSRAVFKDRGSVKYLQAWLGAMQKTTPATPQQYRDRFAQNYMIGVRVLADAAPEDLSAQTVYLNLMLDEMVEQPRNISGWEAIIAQAEKALNLFPEADPKKGVLKRYRGIAATAILQVTVDKPEEFFTRAKEDLEAALVADPADAASAAALGEWHMAAARRARERNEDEAADRLIADGRAGMRAFIERGGVVSPVMFRLLQIEMNEMARASSAASMTVAQFMETHRPALIALQEQVLREPSEKVDPSVAFASAAMGVPMRLTDAGPRGHKVLDHVLASRPTHVPTLFKQAELDMALGDFVNAMLRLQKIAEMPLPPLSVAGMQLLAVREEAVARQVDCALALWQNETKDPAIKAGHLEAAQNIRRKLADMTGATTPRGLQLDGKIAFARGDLIEARRLLDQYLDQTSPPRSDASVLKLLAQVLAQTQNFGAARQQLDRVLQLAPTDAEALLALGGVEIEMGNFEAARRHLERLLELEPNNERARAALGRVVDVGRGSAAEDPLIRLMAQVQEKLAQSTPDFAGAQALLREATEKFEPTERNMVTLAQRLVTLNDLDGAKAAIGRGLQAKPDSRGLKGFLDVINQPDALSRQLFAIEQSDFTPVLKSVLRYQAYRGAGQLDKAQTELDQARAAEPENPLVVSSLFDKALAEGKIDEARRLSDLATARNMDRLNGLVFRLRVAIAEGRVTDALGLAQQAVEQDPLNPVTHRLLGSVQLQMQRFPEAASAFERARQLRVDDVDSTKGLLRARIGLGQVPEALALARESLARAAGDAEFADMWLTLEGEAGDRVKAMTLRQRQFDAAPELPGEGDVRNAEELAALLIREGQFDRGAAVVAALKAAAARAGAQPLATMSALSLEASLLGARGDTAGARKVWEDYIASLPEKDREVRLYVALARFLVGQGQTAAAVEVLEGQRPRQSPEEMEVDREIGDVAFNAGQWDRAATAYGAALEKLTKDEGGRVRLRYVEALLRLSQYEKAAEQARLAERAITPVSQQLLLLKAEAALGLGNRPEAQTLLDQAVEKDRNSPLGFFKRAEFLMGDAARVPDAVTDLQRALQLAPGFTPARVALSRLLLGRQEADRAIALLREGVAVQPADGTVRTELIQTLRLAGRINEALDAAKDAVARFEGGEWRLLAAELHLSAGRLEEATGFYAQAWETMKAPVVARTYGDALLRASPPAVEKVKQVLAEPLVQADRFAPLLMLRARVARIERRDADAEKDIKAAVAAVVPRDPTLEEASGFFADLDAMYPQPRESLALLGRVAPEGGYPVNLRYLIAKVKLRDAATRAEGAADLSALAAAATDQTQKTFALAALQRVGGELYVERNYPGAAEVFAMVVRLNPTAEAKNNLAFTLSKHLGRHDEALPLAEAAAAEEASSATILDTLGSVQLALGRIDDAEKTLTTALENVKPDNPGEQVAVLLHLAEVALARGNRSRAETLLGDAERAMNRSPVVRGLYEADLTAIRKKARGER